MSITYTDSEQLLIELKKLMLDAKITQREIAERIGIKPQGLTKLLSKKNFTQSMIFMLCKMVNVLN